MTALCRIDSQSRFNSCRYPEKPSDIAKKFDPATNNHIVFVRKNKFYEVPILENGEVLSTAELEAYVFCSTIKNMFLLPDSCDSQVENVIRLAGEQKAPPVGALTSENRDIWTEVSPLRTSIWHA